MTVRTVVRAWPLVWATWSATSRTETGWFSATWRRISHSAWPRVGCFILASPEKLGLCQTTDVVRSRLYL